MANLSNINNKFIVTDGGNVLIGQTNNSSGILQIKDAQTSSFNDGLAITRNNAAQTGYINMVGGAFNFNSPGLSYKFRNNGTQTLELNSSGNATFEGNVKIGSSTTGTPAVNADDLVIDKGASESGITLMSTAAASIRFGDAANTSIGSLEYNHNSNYMRMIVNNEEKMRIDSSGNVGIGLDPVYKLDVRGDRIRLNPNSDDFVTAEIQNTTGSFYFGIDNSTGTGFGGANSARCIFSLGDYPMAFYTNSTERMRIDSSGKVIINDNAIGDKLLLAGDDAGTARGLMFNCSTTTNQGDTWDIDAQSALGILKFSTGSTPRLTIDGSGNSTFAGDVNILPGSLGGSTAMSDGTLIFGAGSTNYYSFRLDSNADLHLDKSFAGSNSTVLTVDRSSGNVGIGCSPVAPLQIERASNTTLALSNSGSVTSGTRGEIAVYNSSISTVAAIKAVADTDNVGTGLEFYTRPVGGSLTNSMTIDSSGNSTFAGDVGIADDKKLKFGASTDATMQWDDANNEFEINSGADASEISIIAGTTNTYTSEIQIGARSSAQGEGIFFKTRSTERMRITGVGDIQSNANGGATIGYGFQVSPASGYSQIYLETNATQALFVQRFYNPNGNVGNIMLSGSATTYSTSSDYRLKENVVKMTGALDRVSQLKPSRFNFIADADKTVDGFLAHEVQDIVPEAITGEKDAVDEDGNPDYQGIDQSKLVPLLVGAIQELEARIKILENK